MSETLPVPQTHETPSERRRRRRGYRDPNSPEVIAQQLQIFDLRASGYQVTAIATQLGLSRETVRDFLEIESDRRQIDLGDARMSHIALAVTRYEAIIKRANVRLLRMQQASQQPGKEAKGALRFAVFEEKIIIDAQKRIDKLLGLEPMTSMRISASANTDPETGHVTAGMTVELLSGLQPDQRVRLMQEALAKREERKMVNVTPSSPGS